ncbi:uncharacterized protein LOC125523976 isoform X2 [Triticum urartu]|nr:uncharacterized protein LOC125523976 isoform X2 [Triticum urartu]
MESASYTPLFAREHKASVEGERREFVKETDSSGQVKETTRDEESQIQIMEANCRPDLAAGVDPLPTATGCDWRAELQPRGRSRIVHMIMEATKNFLRVSKPEELNQLREIVAGFENRAYTAATNQSNYLRKISLRMLSMEMKTQQAPRNSRVIPDQTNSWKESPIWTMDGPIGWDPTIGTPPARGDWRAMLQQEDRIRIVDMIIDTLKTRLTVAAPEDLNQLREIVVRYEKRIYTEATNQSDYLPKISLKMLSMEKKRQQPHTQASQKRARRNY